MSNNEAIKMLKARLECVTNLSGDKCSYSSCADCHLCCEQGSLEEQKEYLDIAIKSLEAWGKVRKEIDDSILICQEYAQDDTWCDGELAGFLQSKDIINGNLSEVIK